MVRELTGNRPLIPVLTTALLLVAACSSAASPSPPASTPIDSTPVPTASASPVPSASVSVGDPVADQTYDIREAGLEITLSGSWLGISAADAADPAAVAALKARYPDPTYGLVIDTMARQFEAEGPVFFAYDVSPAALAGSSSFARNVNILAGQAVDSDAALDETALAQSAAIPGFLGHSFRELSIGHAIGLLFTVSSGDLKLGGSQWWVRGPTLTYVITFTGTESQAADGTLESQMEQTLGSLRALAVNP